MADLMQTVLGQVLFRYKMLKDEYLWRKVFSDRIFREWTLDLIRKDQLFKKGIDGDGDIIGTYSAMTESINPKKREGTPYTLFDTGDFYKSFIIYVYKNYIEVDANPIKINNKGEKENLFWKYGENIIALTPTSLNRLRKEFKRRFENELRELLQINK
jgi:hypothetical protein